jgi:hypothetical protein
MNSFYSVRKCVILGGLHDPAMLLLRQFVQRWLDLLGRSNGSEKFFEQFDLSDGLYFREVKYVWLSVGDVDQATPPLILSYPAATINSTSLPDTAANICWPGMVAWRRSRWWWWRDVSRRRRRFFRWWHGESSKSCDESLTIDESTVVDAVDEQAINAHNGQTFDAVCEQAQYRHRCGGIS